MNTRRDHAGPEHTRALAYYEAGARTSSHEDVREIVRIWQQASAEEVDAVPAQLRRVLNALVEGWRS